LFIIEQHKWKNKNRKFIFLFIIEQHKWKNKNRKTKMEKKKVKRKNKENNIR